MLENSKDSKFQLRVEIISRAIVFNQKEKILLVSTDGEAWHFPGGMLNKIESVEDCAKRETFEETGIEIEIEKIKAISDNLRDCRDDFQNFLRTVMFYFIGKTNIDNVNDNHCDIDDCIKYKRFFSEDEFLQIKNFFPSKLKREFTFLKNDNFLYIPFEIFSKDDLKNNDILKLIE